MKLSRSNGFIMCASAPLRMRARDVASVVLRSEIDDRRLLAARQRAKFGQELHRVAVRHLPVDHHAIRHLAAAHVERVGAALGLAGAEVRILQDSPRHLADRAGIVDDETVLHWLVAPYA